MHCYVTANMAGPYHIEKGIVCQDSFCVETISDEITIATVADGLGSEKHSDIGSKIASQVAVKYCAKQYNSNMNADEVKKLMNNAFAYAYNAIIEEVEKENDDEDEYDTTLCLVILDGTKLYYGQSGDSGIVALLNTGEYIKATEEQNDEYGCVFPLCSGPEKWEFGKVNGEVVSVMLMTDGVLKRICHPLLKFDCRDISVNVPLSESFMRRTEKTEEEISLFQDSMQKFLENYPKENIDDDKTVVIIFNTEVSAERMNDSYYSAPDWNNLREIAKSNLYSLDEADEIIDENDEEVNSDNLNLEDTISVSPIESDITEPTILDIDKSEYHSRHCKDSYKGYFENKKPDDMRSQDEHEDDEDNETEIQNNNNSPPKCRQQNKKKHHCNKINSVLIDIIILLTVSVFSVVTYTSGEWATQHLATSYVSVFLLCLLSNSTILLPSISAAIIIQFSFSLNPFIVAILGALGTSIGDMTGFILGFSGNRIIQNISVFKRTNKFNNLIMSIKKKHPYLFVFIISTVPLPIFDIVGIVAGVIKLNPIKFFIATILGRIIKMLLYVFIACQIYPIINM